MIAAIEVGYRHFDTACLCHTEQPLGEAIVEALEKGLIRSRDELFITSKLWCSDGHRDLVVPALQATLRKLKLEYVDMYLIHWPVSSKPGVYEYPPNQEGRFYGHGLQVSLAKYGRMQEARLGKVHWS